MDIDYYWTITALLLLQDFECHPMAGQWYANLTYPFSQRLEQHSCARISTITLRPVVRSLETVLSTRRRLKIYLLSWPHCWKSDHALWIMFEMKIPIRPQRRCSGYPSGWIIATNMALVINCAMTAWALCSTTQPNWLCWPMECEYTSHELLKMLRQE